VAARPDAAWTIPVLLVHYFPARNGRVDRGVTADVDAALGDIRSHCTRTTAEVISALERGSTYHGYKDPGAAPSLRYRIAGSVELLEPLPTRRKAGHALPMTDYEAIMARIEGRRWVLERGVKEVWLWAYHGGVIDMWESNMAGPYGDVSNSDRDATDLPLYGDSTYTFYHYNYGRGASEAIEDHMHQIEAVLREIDPGLFWDRFVGKPGEGRCGWAHYPPNGERDYDWANRTFVETDIEDWRPEGGPRRQMNCERWNGNSLDWFVYWMQNVPGAGNTVAYRGRQLTNWWRFIGDWDGAQAERMKLTI
jgi:hypothetical protein